MREGVNRLLRRNTPVTPVCHVFAPEKKCFVNVNVKNLTGRAKSRVEWEIGKKRWECCMCGMCSERTVDWADLPACSSSRGGRIYSRRCHDQPKCQKQARQTRPTHAGPNRWAGEGWFLPPQDTLTFPPNRKWGREEEQWTEREGLQGSDITF